MERADDGRTLDRDSRGDFGSVSDSGDELEAWGRSELHWAIENYDVKRVGELLSGGADPNAQDGYGQTPLHGSVDTEVQAAERFGFIDSAMTHLLLVFGANSGILDDQGKTPEEWAAATNHQPALLLFKHYKSDG